MGLAITRGLLTAAGGRVWGENVPGAAHDSRSSFPDAPAPSVSATDPWPRES